MSADYAVFSVIALGLIAEVIVPLCLVVKAEVDEWRNRW